MGYLREKYTKEYYTGRDSLGNKLNYGAEMLFDTEGNLTLRNQDFLIMKQIDFHNRNILSLGCGRGEELCYAITNGANIKNTIGLDFSPAAIQIAKDLLKKRKLKEPKFITSDALTFIKEYAKHNYKNDSKKFDIVIMFDFVEHIPRNELREMLSELQKVINKKCVLLVNTPAYRHDNDVIQDGLDQRNLIETIDTSDLVPETEGMHCNKYSLQSLSKFMHECGYINITETHFFVLAKSLSTKLNIRPLIYRWNYCMEKGYPLKNEYAPDQVDYAYIPKKPSLLEKSKLLVKRQGVLLTSKKILLKIKGKLSSKR